MDSSRSAVSSSLTRRRVLGPNEPFLVPARVLKKGGAFPGDGVFPDLADCELAFRHIFGTDMWTRLAERPEAARLFDEAMQSLTQGANALLITNYPFEKFSWIVDVGGGNGSL